MVTVRKISPGDIERAAELTAAVFAQSEMERQHIHQLTVQAYQHCPFMPMELGYVAEEDGQVVAKWQLVNLSIRLGCVNLRVAGAQALVTDPKVTGKSYMLAIAVRGRKDLAESGYDLALGFTQHRNIFQAFGCVNPSAEYLWRCPTEKVPDTMNINFRLAEESDVPRLVDLHNAANTKRPTSIVRSTDYWPWMVRGAKEIWISDHGYVGIRRGGDGLELRDIGADNDAFFAQALSKLARLARAENSSHIFGHVPENHPIVVQSKPWGGTVETLYPQDKGSMAVVLDVPRLLKRTQPELERRLKLCGWSSPLQLHVHCQNRTTQLELLGAAEQAPSLELSVDRGALMRLLFGYAPHQVLLKWHPKSTWRATGADCAELMTMLFPHQHPYIWHVDRF